MALSTTARSSVRVVIVDDHVLFAESLELAFSVEGYDVRSISVPTEERAPGALVAAVTGLRPRVVLLDLDLGGFGDGGRLITPLARSGANVVVVTASIDRGRWGEAVRYGARKVLPKSRPLNEILAAVRRISQGLPVMSREEREELLAVWHGERANRQEVLSQFEALTVRERQILGHLMRGRNVREIAAAGVVSEATVRTQIKSILGKLGVTSQLAAAGLAHSIDWRPPSG
jgi:two-component system, NarL family, nitrate/nitrite response regulator NarL